MQWLLSGGLPSSLPHSKTSLLPLQFVLIMPQQHGKLSVRLVCFVRGRCMWSISNSCMVHAMLDALIAAVEMQNPTFSLRAYDP